MPVAGFEVPVGSLVFSGFAVVPWSVGTRLVGLLWTGLVFGLHPPIQSVIWVSRAAIWRRLIAVQQAEHWYSAVSWGCCGWWPGVGGRRCGLVPMLWCDSRFGPQVRVAARQVCRWLVLRCRWVPWYSAVSRWCRGRWERDWWVCYGLDWFCGSYFGFGPWIRVV